MFHCLNIYSYIKGLPEVLGNKGTLAKVSKGISEDEPIFREQGNRTLQVRKQRKQIYQKKTKYGKRLGTWEHRAVLEGNKDPPGPSMNARWLKMR